VEGLHYKGHVGLLHGAARVRLWEFVLRVELNCDNRDEKKCE
jgi:hypothetical protein